VGCWTPWPPRSAGWNARLRLGVIAGRTSGSPGAGPRHGGASSQPVGHAGSERPAGAGGTARRAAAPVLGWRRHEWAVGSGTGRPRRRDRGRGPAAGRARCPGRPRPRPAVPGGRCAEGPPGHRLPAGRAADGRDRRGGPAGSAVVRLPGGCPLPALGGALGADLPAGQPGDRGAPGAAGQLPGGHRVRPDGPR
jgi:hypothetical protein